MPDADPDAFDDGALDALPAGALDALPAGADGDVMAQGVGRGIGMRSGRRLSS